MKIKAKVHQRGLSAFNKGEVYIVGTLGQKLKVIEAGGSFDGMVSPVYLDEVSPVDKDLRTLTLFSLLKIKVKL